MKEAKDLNRIEYAIYYWNICCSLFGCAVLIYWNWQVGTIVVFGGYIIYKILWFSRRSIYQIGASRFYFLGAILYLSFILSIFVRLNMQKYNLMIPPPDILQLNAYLTHVTTNLPTILHVKHIIFSFVSGVLLYVFNVELRRKNIVERDLMGIQIDDRELFNINPNMCKSLDFI